MISILVVLALVVVTTFIVILPCIIQQDQLIKNLRKEFDAEKEVNAVINNQLHVEIGRLRQHVQTCETVARKSLLHQTGNKIKGLPRGY